MYNKTAIYKWREAHPEEYSIIKMKASVKWKVKNPEKVKEQDRRRKSPFMTEWRMLRNIALF